MVQAFETEAESFAYGGEAVARAPDGRVAFVSGAIPGERVVAVPVSEHKGYLKCAAGEIISPSPRRIAPEPEGMPGCPYSIVEYPAEAEAKKIQLAGFLARASRAAGAPEPPAVEAHPCEPHLAYRNKITLHAARAGGRFLMGFTAERSHKVIDAARCPLACDAINAIIPEARKACAAGMRGPGAVVFRHTAADGALWWGGKRRPEKKFLAERTAGLEFRVRAEGFYQVNPFAGDALVRKAAEIYMRDPEPEIADLYCGVGVFGITFAARAAESAGQAPLVRGAETDAGAVECARANAGAHGVKAEFAACGAGVWLAARRAGARAMIVADPPRGGFEKGAARAIASSGAARVMCVSCDPATLARDIAPLFETYSLEEAHMFDMFPRTARFESLLLFKRRA